MKLNFFGQYLRCAREKKGLTQTALGDILGVTNKAISKWENGSAYPSGDLIYPLSEAIGIPFGEVYSVMNKCINNESGTKKYRIFSVRTLIILALIPGANIISFLLSHWNFIHAVNKYKHMFRSFLFVTTFMVVYGVILYVLPPTLFDPGAPDKTTVLLFGNIFLSSISMIYAIYQKKNKEKMFPFLV